MNSTQDLLKELDEFDEELLNEDSNLYRGIFWIKDIDNPKNDLMFKIPTDEYGNYIGDYKEASFNSKSGTSLNHKRTWEKLHQNKPFDYYPRGRVEISNGVAKIFINPHLRDKNIINLIKSEYNLTKCNGIKDIKILDDNSEHYKCYLDREQ